MCRKWEGVVEVINRDTLDTISSVKNTKNTRWWEIIQPEGVVIASCYNMEEKSAEITFLNPDSLEKSHSIDKRSVDKLTHYRIAHYLSSVYVVDWREKQLRVYNLVDSKMQKLSVPGMKTPLSVCILPDSTILIGDYTEDGEMSRYKVENTTLALIWKFSHISLPTGICFDLTSELIHICTREGPLLILSLEGK